MAIDGGDVIQVTLKQQYGSEDLMSVWCYEVNGTFTPGTAAQIGNAWWNHVKATYRALVRPSAGFTFNSVVVRSLSDPLGDLGEWSIPSNEQQGTRTGVDSSEFLPPFVSVGVRLSVANRTTRPGQKRYAGLLEADSDGGIVNSAYKTLLNSNLAVMTAQMVLGAPIAGMALDPVVVGLNADGTIRASQVITGAVVNNYLTSQVSRRFGRGM